MASRRSPVGVAMLIFMGVLMGDQSSTGSPVVFKLFGRSWRRRREPGPTAYRQSAGSREGLNMNQAAATDEWRERDRLLRTMPSAARGEAAR